MWTPPVTRKSRFISFYHQFCGHCLQEMLHKIVCGFVVLVHRYNNCEISLYTASSKTRFIREGALPSLAVANLGEVQITELHAGIKREKRNPAGTIHAKWGIFFNWNSKSCKLHLLLHVRRNFMVSAVHLQATN